MITLSLDDAARHLSSLRESIKRGTGTETATLTDDGKPVLALLPWNVYEALLEMAQIPTDPRHLLAAPAPLRQQALTVAAARADIIYSQQPDLLAYEAYGHDDLFECTE